MATAPRLDPLPERRIPALRLAPLPSSRPLSPTAARHPGLGAFLLALGLIAIAFACVLLTMAWESHDGAFLLAAFLSIVAATIIALIGMLRAQAALARLRASGVALSAAEAKARQTLIVANGFIAIGNLALFLFGAGLTLLTTSGFGRGRQLRRRGEILLPPIERGSAWSLTPRAPVGRGPAPAALAAQWRENGRTEHASVAAFAQLTLDLAALGAPPRLLADAQRDALDEIRHAELCFGLARELDGRPMSPAPFRAAGATRRLPPGRTLALARLAVDSLVDGALHEGTSARVIARLARRCEDPAIATMLREIAADESRHASHGWDVVAWCLAEGGEGVAAALRGAARAIPPTMRSSIDERARDGSWERHGISGAELEAEEYSRARMMIHARLARILRVVPGTTSA